MSTETVVQPRDLNTHHMPHVPSTLGAWELRAADLRAQLRFSLGLTPAPPKTPLHPRVTGRFVGDGFVVENVAIETLPGFWLCGNLYRPASGKGPFPAIVKPHGHWEHGRLERRPDVTPPAPGAPPAEGRADMVALSASLARQGFVVFAYDMVGYNGTDQLGPHGKFAADLQAWLWNVSLAGLQTWDSIRVVDYLSRLPYVDKNRIGVTGASGGGTQSFLLCAVDDRIKAAVPVNMVSAYMQGGCTCENAPGLRIGTDNVEIAALMAPKPMLLVAATGDWTSHVPTEEWPAIHAVYELYGAGDRTAVRQFNYGHNYNVESREAMYAWFARWLRGVDEQPRERPVELDPARLRVWTARSKRPAGALDAAQLIAQLAAEARRWLDSLTPRDAAGLRRFRKEIAPELALSLDVTVPAPAKTHRGSTGAPAVLLVSDPASTERADGLKAALAARGCAVTDLRLPAIEATDDQLWDKFFSTYNRVPLGDRVQRIVDALASLETASRRRVAVVGVGAAGPWALLAAALVPGASRVAVDACGIDTSRDDAYLPALYAPGLRRAGDLRSAAILTAPAALCLYNTGGVFETRAIGVAFRGKDAPRPRFEAGEIAPDALAAWVIGR